MVKKGDVLMALPITAMVGKAMDSVLYPLASFNPVLSLTISSLIMTTLLLSLYQYFYRKNNLKELRQKLEFLKEELIKVQVNKRKEEMEKTLNEYIQLNNKFIKFTLQIMVISIIVGLLFFSWMEFRFEKTAKVILPVKLPIVGNQLNWFGWYLILSFTIAWVIRRLLEWE